MVNIKRVEGIDKSNAYSEEPMTMDGCAWGGRSCFVAHKTGGGFLEVRVKSRMDWARWRGPESAL